MAVDAERLRKELREARGGLAVELIHRLAALPLATEVGEDADLDWLVAAAHRGNEDGDYTRSSRMAEVALIRGLTEHPELHAVALVERAVSIFHTGSPAECADVCARGLPIVAALDPPSPILHAQFEAQRAIALKQQGLRDAALELNLRGLERLGDATDRLSLDLRATLHNNIATIYLGQGDDAAGIAHFERGLTAIRLLPEPGLVEVVTLLNLGRVQLRAGDERAAETLQAGLLLARETGQPKIRMFAQEALAVVHRREGSLGTAADQLRQVLGFWEDQDEPVPLARTLKELGHTLTDLDDPDAEPILHRAIALAGERGLIEIEQAATDALARFLEGRERYREACALHRRSDELQKAAFDQQRSRQVEELRAAYEAAAREAEAEVLRVRTEELEQLVHARTADLEVRNTELTAARDAARAASRAKSSFLAVVSHELRTPLNAIVGYTELIRDDVEAGELDAGEIASDLGRILESADKLRGLIDRILSLTEIEAGKAKPVRVDTDLGALLRDRVAAHRERAERKALALTLDDRVDGTILTDGARVARIVDQLLGNALAFTLQGSVEVRAERREGEIRIAVRDTGVGIEPEDLAPLLDPLSQADMSYTRTHEGLGLGLSLCAAQCRVLGGRLEASSTPGSGSTFQIVLPS